jgi:hypothetical protein
VKFKDTRYGNLTGQTYNGDINVSNIGLTSLEGAPKVVEGRFYCSYNNLTSLEGAPRVVKKHFYCDYNKLNSLEGAPKIVKGYFNCYGNKLVSLEYLPEDVTPQNLISDFSEKEVLEFFKNNRPEVLI